ncbi:MAG: GlsB/YeaQ/YmgE family stress response membrane protein [Anaerolineae bacterium]|nr:GlsB/YeaQ/YmgE family stress response membrane protein [Anaerolineae bacterium]
MTLEQLVVWIIVGGIAGFLADIVVRRIKLGFFEAIVVGILGAFVGGWLFGVLGIIPGAGIVGSILTAFVGAVILLFIFAAARQR